LSQELNAEDLQPVVQALLANDVAYIDTVPEDRDELIGLGAMVAFTVLVRDVFADDATITAAASSETFEDADGRTIPAWVIEAAIRYALGEQRAIEGVEPGIFLDAYSAFLRLRVYRSPLPPSKIDELAEAGTTNFLEAINESTDPAISEPSAADSEH
jgi:hypothetical protein